VSDDSVDLRCSRLDEVLGRETDGAAGIGHVVNQDGNLALYRTNENHSRLKTYRRYESDRSSAQKEAYEEWKAN
jgi:hypothetical protein